MNNYYVYEYYVLDTNEVFYVGKGCGKRAYSGKRNKFCEDMKKTHNWKCRIVCSGLAEKEALSVERQLIARYRKKENNRLTNVADGGVGAPGYKHSESQKRNYQKLQKQNGKTQILSTKCFY